MRPKTAGHLLYTLGRRGLLTPGRPDRVVRQFTTLARWGLSLAGEFRSAAQRDPHRPAVVDEQGTLTYGEVVGRVERLALALRASYQVGTETRVGILCRNHRGMLETVLACATLGADTVLLNTGLSPSQVLDVLAEQQVELLVADAEFAVILGAAQMTHMPRITDAELADLIAHGYGHRLDPPERQGCTVVLTSGTTGTPKGARRPTPPTFTPLASVLSRIPLRVGDRMLVAAPMFHTWGYAATQIGAGLRATVVLRRRFDPEATLADLSRQRCTVLFAVPVMLQRLLEVPDRVRRRYDLGALRVVASSGSALPGDFATRFMNSFGDCLYNLYGSTEASWVSIATPADLRKAPRCAGRPPFGTRLAILGSDGRPVPDGQVGRIFVGNEMLFDGYTDAADKERRDGMLATGDVGHLDQGGLLHVDGREDDMVVSGSENVFPSEVEHLLAGLPQVRECAVVGVPDREWGQRLAAYVVLYPDEVLDADAVREFVRYHLARFAVPRDVYFLAELPRNATGKVMVRHLPR